MHDRPGRRPSHVRPRSPSTGRPAPVKVRPQPATGRITSRRSPRRQPRLPILPRLILVAAVAALCVAVFFTATGGVGRLFASIGRTVASAIGDLTATAPPSIAPVVVADRPIIAAPEEPYTNQVAIDLVVTIPSAVVGDSASLVRLYLQLPGQQPAPILELPVSASRQLVIPAVELTSGQNDFTATIRNAAGESRPSPVVTWFLDQVPPQITLASPADGQTVNAGAVSLVGRTQPRTTLVARNDVSGASATALAAADGSFELVVGLEPGANPITISATDPAANAAQLALTVHRGTGALAASLFVEPPRIRVGDLPAAVDLAVLVIDPDGRPVPSATVSFQLSVPGVRIIASEAVTGADGRAAFRTTIPAGAHAGDGMATALARTAAFGQTTARTPLKLVK